MKKVCTLFLVLVACSFYGTAQEISSKDETTNRKLVDSKKIKVFPNPATNVVHLLGLADSHKAYITISDMYGNAVLQRKWAIRDASLSIPVPNLQSGIYVVSVESPEQKIQVKFYKN